MNEPATKPVGVSVPVLVLSILLAVAVTAAVVLALRGGGSSGTAATMPADPGLSPQFVPPQQPPQSPSGDAGTKASADAPFVQTDTVSPEHRMTGRVYYPLPYASPPHLKLKAKERKYDILEQDENGFAWGARPKLEDFDPKYLEAWKDDATNAHSPQKLLGSALTAIGGGVLKPNLTFEDFSWEAQGVRGRPVPKPFEQSGTFNSLANGEGQVTYPIPYARPANVTLNGGNWGFPFTTIVESRPDGFRWKNTVPEKSAEYGTGSVSWTAKGLRGTE